MTSDRTNEPLKNVLYVNYCLAMGGIETMIVGFIDALKGTNFVPHVAVFEAGGVLDEVVEQKGAPLFDLKKKPGIDIGLFFRIAKVIKQQDIEVVHTNNFATWLYVTIACFFMRNVRVIHTEHSTVRGHKKRRYLAEKLISYITYQVVTVSEQVKTNMVELCHVAPSKISVITNGIDIDKFKLDQTVRKSIREKLNIEPSCILFGTVGRAVPVKDQASMIKAFSKISPAEPVAKLAIVGDGPCLGDLRKLVAELSLEDRVLLLGERHDIPDLLSAMDVYVVSSLSEGMSISMLEAMSSSLPVIATNVGGNPELVHQDQNGLLVEVGNPESIAQGMCFMRDHETERKAMAVLSREMVVKGFSNEAMMTRYKQLYTGSQP